MTQSPIQRILSGVQPTGNLHLGNYLGAIRNWKKLQDTGAECLYGIMDLHAITVPQKPDELRKATREVTAALVACGIDPKRSFIFNQSSVSAHSELAWLLSCHTPLGWLNRMTQFKEKAGKHRDNAVLGLYSYPVLMAADILIYKATHVPVGEDQKQHLELARDIAGAFNRYYECDFFPLPEPLIMGEATRVMSLRDGTKKMSKSDESDYSRINLTDDADTIALKFRKAKSDMAEGVTYDPELRPEASNLITLYAAFKDMPVEGIEAELKGMNFSAFKQLLTELAVSHLSPITNQMRELMKDTGYIDRIIGEGAARANEQARATYREIKALVGFLEISA
ncbi:MAG: tryptophan--tRNA ligase [Rickettsiales bacterium]|nr:tryptophan--tRNA ligase [Rickettsiales bacterium]